MVYWLFTRLLRERARDYRTQPNSQLSQLALISYIYNLYLYFIFHPLQFDVPAALLRYWYMLLCSRCVGWVSGH